MKYLLVFVLVVSSVTLAAEEFNYDAIAQRHSKSALNADKVNAAKMQGECLVGLKNINYKKKDVFDPIAEWSSYRSISLLEQFSPCEVLIMMEIAQKQMRADMGL